MSNRRLVYVAGPFAGQGETAEARKAAEAINVNRACFVGHILWKYRGYAPIVPHAIGTMVYGDDHDAEVRERSIDAGVSMAEGIGRAGGSFFGIRRDDGAISEGTGRELDAWHAAHDARKALGVEQAVINWNTLFGAAIDSWSVHANSDPLHKQHIVWVGSFWRFLDQFTVGGDWQMWERAHGSLGAKGDR